MVKVCYDSSLLVNFNHSLSPSVMNSICWLVLALMQIAEIVQAVKSEDSIHKWSISDNIIETIAQGILEGK